MATAYDSGEGESILTRRRQRRKRTWLTFLYDVGVNAVANVVVLAGGVLVAQATGLLQENPALTRIAAAVLTIAGGVAVVNLLLLLTSRLPRRLRVAAAVLASFLVVTGVSRLNDAIVPDELDRAFLLLLLGITAVVFVLLVVRIVRERR